LPEAMKPRRIAVNAGDGNDHQQIEPRCARAALCQT